MWSQHFENMPQFTHFYFYYWEVSSPLAFFLLLVKCLFSLRAAFKIFSLSLMLSVSLWLPGWAFLSIYSAWDLLGLLSLRFAVLYQFWKILICFLLQYFLLPIVSLLSFWDSDLDISRSFFFDSKLMFLGTLISDNSLKPEFKVKIFILCQWLRGLH